MASGKRPPAKGSARFPFGGHETAREFRENIEAPFFRYYLHGKGDKFPWKASTFQSGSNTWHTYSQWPPQGSEADQSLLPRGRHALLRCSGRRRSQRVCAIRFRSRQSGSLPAAAHLAHLSGGDWRTWEVADQRFVDHRPDVISYVSAPLEHDLVVTGPLAAELFASTSGTDSDFVVKLIDVFPEDAVKDAWKAESGPAPGEYAKSLNGYLLPIAMEVRRGRYNKSYSNPEPLVPNQPTQFTIPLRDHDHVFLKGHRLMVQVQSTWFPVIDRNPQTFVSSIYVAKASDFVPATQRVYSTPNLPSHIVLPVMP